MLTFFFFPPPLRTTELVGLLFMFFFPVFPWFVKFIGQHPEL